MGSSHLLKMWQKHIAYPEHTRAASIALLHHGFPDLGIGFGPVIATRRSVEHEAVDVIGAEMLERTRHRLTNLEGKRSCGIVGQAVVLTALIGKFRLQKKICARDQTRAIRS